MKASEQSCRCGQAIAFTAPANGKPVDSVDFSTHAWVVTRSTFWSRRHNGAESAIGPRDERHGSSSVGSDEGYVTFTATRSKPTEGGHRDGRRCTVAKAQNISAARHQESGFANVSSWSGAV